MSDNHAFRVVRQKSKLLLSTLLQSSYAPIEHAMEQGFFVWEVVEKTTLAHLCLSGHSIQCKVSRS